MSKCSESKLLLKGLEEEVYTGAVDGRIIPLSGQIARDLPEYHTEPDGRNVEFVTEPHADYGCLTGNLMDRRMKLREYLQEHGGYTLVQGATLSLETDDTFHLSKDDNPYYRFIRDSYGIDVVTASSHINIGIPNVETLIRAYRVIRMEASMYLALTASSPFLKGEVTGYHSTRWHIFPQTPPAVPMFRTHAHFVQWVQSQLQSGAMQNPRHLWLSVRPNGPQSPDVLTRLELRICDRISDLRLVGAVTALYEARTWQIIENSRLDPLLLHEESQLTAWAAHNEAQAAKESLYATIIDWRTGEERTMQSWVEEFVDNARFTAEAHGFAEHLSPIQEILDQGNVAQRWLRLHARGVSPQEIINRANQRKTTQDIETEFSVC